ncbi:hypothetical protein PSP31121_04768 [Pandoraea sputorum]|uniref:Uncharacterized protein n=1 Tax=Pandoraea sputorum TaxID=93222 RepID=A0A5E5BEX2_9BURK|nr:hypothetical protein PSP31121_04768 [Pandoraea sputorum]
MGGASLEARIVVADARIHGVGLNAIARARDVTSEEILAKRTFIDFA